MKNNTLDLAALWERIPAFDRLLQQSYGHGTEVLGLSEEARLLLAVALFRARGGNLLYLVKDEDRAKKTARRLRHHLHRDEVGWYPLRELLPYEVAGQNRAPARERIRIYEGLLGEEPFFAVAPVEVLTRMLLPATVYKESRLSLAVGDCIDPGLLAERLVNLGYERQPLTEEPGDFSVRGSVIDVYPPAAPQPFRLDFFDDELESLRRFDPERQVSVGEAERVDIGPADEFLLPADGGAAARERLCDEGARTAGGLRGEAKKRCQSAVQRWCEVLGEELGSGGAEHLLPFVYDRLSALEDYLPAGTLFVLDEGAELLDKLKECEREQKLLTAELMDEGEILPAYSRNYRSYEDIWPALTHFPAVAFSFLPTLLPLDVTGRVDFPLREFSFYRPREERGHELQELAAKLRPVFCAGDGEALAAMARFAETWQLKDFDCCLLPLEKSFELSEPPLCCIAQNDLLAFAQTAEPKKKARRQKALDSFIDLKEGDYVVHETHGIGQYMGVERLRVGEVERDYLLVRYSGKDKLYIPTEQMDLLQKYIGNGEATPKVNKLGGKEWQHTKERVRLSVQDMAKELLKLYGERAAEQGFAFSPDQAWQLEMENDFPFEETPDQLEAIRDVKADMEAARPMERLLCGDVGYGKTEVALRAAFKAVLDGKQAAVLVPTTILAQQHERTFRERLEKFGVRIGVLSRFKTRREIDDALERLRTGALDIVIGTHMLFNRRVHFRDLGLLVIDEEQRFGVAHKEKIKQLKNNVDVLAMSATPIPRTLHMSLLGVRDISIIETPPRERRAVQTFVLERQTRVIREAVQRELAREGQVYFIHNRIDSIYKVAAELRELVPEARVLIGHGRMSETELERVMLGFLNGDADILLSTTIVESGLDFPNVNTMIVDESDHLGLSQLYQLRGRVGRSPKQAYAYFFYPRGKLLELTARKRLAAIREYTELGSGFKIALRDMEIRGAGNILGAEQHGHLISVGFDMYCRLIDEEVRRLKGEAVPESAGGATVELTASAFLPDEYIGDNEIKIEFYKKIAEVKTKAELKALMAEMEDRFGSVPDSVYNLFIACLVKLYAEKLEITTVSQQKGSFVVTFKELNSISGAALAELAGHFGRRFAFKMGTTLEMTVRYDDLPPAKGTKLLIKIFDALIKREKANDV